MENGDGNQQKWRFYGCPATVGILSNMEWHQINLIKVSGYGKATNWHFCLAVIHTCSSYSCPDDSMLKVARCMIMYTKSSMYSLYTSYPSTYKNH